MKKFYYFFILQIIFYNIDTQTSLPERINLIEEFYRSINTKDLSDEDKNTYTKFIQLKGRAYDFYFETNNRTKKQLLEQAIQNAKSIKNISNGNIFEALNNALFFANSILKK